MAFGDSYEQGTVSSSGATITGIGTGWSGSIDPLLRTVLPGDIFWSDGTSAPIQEVVSNTELTLRNDWPGSALSGAEYSIEYLSGHRHKPTLFSSQLIDISERLRLFETAVPVFSVVAFGLNVPAGSEVVGEFVVVGTAGTGAFAGHNNEIAEKTDTGWLFRVPQHGYHAIDEEDNLVRAFDGVNWSSGIGLGVNVTYQGSYDAGIDYVQGDLVTYADEAWIANQDSTGQTPGVASIYWDKFVGIGVSEGFVYAFSTDLTNSNPTTGKIKFSAVPAGAASMTARISRIDAVGGDLSGVLSLYLPAVTSSVKATLSVVQKQDRTRRVLGEITAITFVDDTIDYYNLTLTNAYLMQNAMQDGEEVVVQFSRTGDKGTTGTTGATGATGARGVFGGANVIPYVTDALSQENSAPASGELRFGSLPMNAATTLRLNLIGSDASSYTGLIDSIPVGVTSTVKAQGRLTKPTDESKYLAFDIYGVEVQSLYRNLTVIMRGSSGANPFADNDPVVFTFLRVGDKGDAGEIVGVTYETGEPGTAVEVENTGTTTDAVLHFTIPQGDTGDNFQPQYVVELIADRDDYDAGPVFDDDGIRLSVLVVSDSTNDDKPTLYFLIAPTVWSDPITFGVASNAALEITYDNTDSGMVATNVQAAIDELKETADDQPDPVAMAMIFGS